MLLLWVMSHPEISLPSLISNFPMWNAFTVCKFPIIKSFRHLQPLHVDKTPLVTNQAFNNKHVNFKEEKVIKSGALFPRCFTPTELSWATQIFKSLFVRITKKLWLWNKILSVKWFSYFFLPNTCTSEVFHLYFPMISSSKTLIVF